MPDSKITALTSIGASTDPANDPLVLVDVSDTSMAATGTTKKVTLNQLLGASGTATLASATITGDLTVDTSTLKVDSANDRVGIGTASPAAFKLHVNGASGNQMVLSNGGEQFTLVEYRNGGTLKVQQYWDNTNTIFENYLSSGSHAFTWKASATEWMRLNSTGLGVGVTPSAKLTIAGNSIFTVADAAYATALNATTGNLRLYPYVDANYGSALIAFNAGYAGYGPLTLDASRLSFYISGSERFRIDTSGNVVVGTAAIATTATDGFLYVTGCAGTPTGTPTAKTGRVPLVVDTTNNKLYFYSGGSWVAAN